MDRRQDERATIGIVGGVHPHAQPFAIVEHCLLHREVVRGGDDEPDPDKVASLVAALGNRHGTRMGRRERGHVRADLRRDDAHKRALTNEALGFAGRDRPGADHEHDPAAKVEHHRVHAAQPPMPATAAGRAESGVRRPTAQPRTATAATIVTRPPM